jgi:nicotinamidase-related amidase
MDMQCGTVNSPEKQKLAEKIIELTQKQIYDRVVCIRFVNRDDGVFPEFHRYYDMHKGKDIELIDGLVADLVIPKSTYSCINEDFLSKLAKINDMNKVREVSICGIGTDTSILKTSLDLFERHVKPIILANYCIAYDNEEKSHKRGIKLISKLIGERCIVKKDINSLEDLK